MSGSGTGNLLIGDAGADYILTALSSTRHPLQFIEEFQQANGISPSNDMFLFHSIPLSSPPQYFFLFHPFHLLQEGEKKERRRREGEGEKEKEKEKEKERGRG
jgi:hypothetical protein